MVEPDLDRRAPGKTSKRMLLERFPVTILLGVQLSAMIALPAVMKGTQPLGLILGICAAAVGVALYVELLMQPLAPSTHAAKSVSLRAAATVLTVGVVAVIGSTLGGRGSYAVQLGLETESPIVAVTTPFTTWVLFGVSIFLWLYRRGQVSRRLALWILAGASALYLWEGLTRAILGQSAAFIMTLLVLAVFARLIPLRAVVVALVLIPLLWPPIYELRDAMRRATSGAVAVSANAAMERLQMDREMANVALLVPRPAGLEPLDPLTLVRIGLIPGFLDGPRPPLDTGSRLSLALGGTATNSQSATMLGNLYVFEGWAGIAVFAAALAVAMGVLVRRDSPWALAGVGLLYTTAMSFNASYPDVIPRILQALVSMAVAYLVVRLLSGRNSNASALHASGGETSSG